MKQKIKIMFLQDTKLKRLLCFMGTRLNQFRILVPLLGFGLTACQLWQPRDDSDSVDTQPAFDAPLGMSRQDESFFMTDKDLKKLKNGKDLLSKIDIKKDKTNLLYALNNGYIGKHFFGKAIFDDVIHKVEQLDGPMLRFDFLNEVRKILYSFRDGHLYVTTVDGVLPKDVYQTKRAKPLGPKQKYWWMLETHTIKGKQWHVLTLTDFPYFSDPKWQEVYAALNSVKESNGLLIDLRDNGGGFVMSAHHLQQYLRPLSNFEKPKMEYVHRSLLSPILHMNTINDDFRGHHDEISRSRLKAARDSLVYDILVTHPLVTSYPEKLPEPRYPPHPLWQKTQLYLIVDGGCVSACEVLTENLQHLNDVVSIGKNTAGVFHFGTAGLLYLRKSALKVYLPSTYSELASKKFIEGDGVEPEFKVENTDSLDKTFETFLNSNLNSKKNSKPNSKK